MDNTCTDNNTIGNAASNLAGEAPDPTGVIPFADEPCAATRWQGPSTPGHDSAIDALGDLEDDAMGDPESRGSVVDRELGLDEHAGRAREGQYLCPCCGMGATRVVRVRIVSHAGWAAVCAVCAASLLERLPGTIVGGMVKPSRKRRINTIRTKTHAQSGKQAHRDGLQEGPSGGQAARGFRGSASGGYRRAG